MNEYFDQEKIQGIVQSVIPYAINFLIAIAIFIIGKWIARKITNVVVLLLNKTNSIDVTLVKFFESIIYYILMIVVVLTALSKVGVETTSFFAILGAAGLAIGLALKDSLGNFASGVMLIMFKPFKVGDFVTVAGVSGSVKEISIFSSIIITGDNQKMIVPNGAITSGTIVNVNANPTRRVDLLVGIGYEDDIKKTKELLTNILESEDRIIQNKGLTVAVSELADSSVNFVVRAWVNTPDYWAVKFALTEQVKLRFDKEGISIPYPQQDVHIHNQA
ncbi:mechanosensitive ion channel family protein [Poseidonibacter antarcticus]|uniref:mechanosensitive ion channel family protein n=1 Tax=Poseidonibacter antarcticus TaxID=2478538 RepID=UPI000EF4AE41|nr:mechanosensitive ion channel domain-containing protein [Poseidonibacter antarcticus]